MDVSENSGFSPYNRLFHYFHHPFLGTTMFGVPPICIQLKCIRILSFQARCSVEMPSFWAISSLSCKPVLGVSHRGKHHPHKIMKLQQEGMIWWYRMLDDEVCTHIYIIWYLYITQIIYREKVFLSNLDCNFMCDCRLEACVSYQ